MARIDLVLNAHQGIHWEFTALCSRTPQAVEILLYRIGPVASAVSLLEICCFLRFVFAESHVAEKNKGIGG